jgi:anti-repressor protein
MNHMDEMTPFNFEGNQVRTVMIDDEPYFVGKDAALAIGYKNTRKAIHDHVKPKYQREERIVTPSGIQTMTLISEPGIYQLAGQSKLPSAEPFQDWIYEDVLPSIRKNGMYATPESAAELLKDPANLIQLLQNYADTQSKLVEEHDQRLIVEQQLSEAKPKADYTDQVLRSRGTMIVSEFAQDYGMSPRAFNKLLHESGVQYKARGVWVLYSKYQGKGYTKTTTHSYQHSNGLMGGRIQMEWTQKGRLFLYEFLKKQGVLPVMEQQKLDLKVY